MKKFFVLFAVMAFVATFSFGQKFGFSCDSGKDPNTQIANGVERSKPVNKLVGIEDLNKIWPGQTVWVPVEVKKGDTFWGIYRDFIYPYYPGYIEPLVESEPTEVETISNEPVSLSGHLHKIGLILLIVILLIAFFKILNDYLKSKNNNNDQDPITAGPAQVPGGVTDRGAHYRMRELSSQRFPGAYVNIQNIRRGKLSGKAIVHYAEGKPKKLNLNKVIAYAGEVMVNNQLETIYFLQGCGNDARQGNYMQGNELVFIPDAIINEDGSETDFPNDDKQGKDSVSHEQFSEAQESLTKKNEEGKNTDSEDFRIKMKILDIVKDASDGDVHSISFDLSSSGLKTTINYKSPQNKKQNEADDKK